MHYKRWREHGELGGSASTKHGERHKRLYTIWVSMRSGTTNPKSNRWSIYGGRGVMVCEEWKKSYTAFRDYVVPLGYSDHLTLDRIDNDKGYEPGNVRWATYTQQARNQRLLTSRNTSGYRGVTSCHHGKWKAHIRIDGTLKHLGYFPTASDAARAYNAAALKYFGSEARLNPV
jgi:hypothetical protein